MVRLSFYLHIFCAPQKSYRGLEKLFFFWTVPLIRFPQLHVRYRTSDTASFKRDAARDLISIVTSVPSFLPSAPPAAGFVS